MSAQGKAVSPPSLFRLPRMSSMRVGYHAIHPDVSLNFQMNRWFSWIGEMGMLEEMRTVAPRIATYADWQREFSTLAQKALAKAQIDGQNLRAAYYLRAAEFFLQADKGRVNGIKVGGQPFTSSAQVFAKFVGDDHLGLRYLAESEEHVFKGDVEDIHGVISVLQCLALVEQIKMIGCLSGELVELSEVELGEKFVLA